MMTMIERLKAATEGTAELDLAITAALGHTGGAGWFSRSLDAAVTLMPEGMEWDVSFTRLPHSPPRQAIIYLKPFWGSSDHDRDARVIGEAATSALALCIAALMAREERT